MSEPADSPKKKKKSKKSSKDKSASPKKSKKTSTKATVRTASSEEQQLPDVELETPILRASGWEEVDFATKGVVSKPTTGLKYAITGNEQQIVTIALGSNQSCQGEPGSMMYLTPNVDMSVSCMGCWQRCLGGESCCVMHFRNHDHAGKTGYAALVPSDPLAKVIPVDLSAPHVGGQLTVQQGTYMASYGEVDVGMSCDCNFCRCCCGGMGLVRQRIEGTGTVFLGATGTIVQKVLADKEVLVVDTNCLLAYSKSCTFDLKRAGGVVGMVGGGEGIFNSTITGPGLCIVQSMNKALLLEALAAQKLYRR